MNKKYILTALCATSFFGANITANPEGTSESSIAPQTNLFKQIQDKDIRQYCKKNFPEDALCLELANLLAAGLQDVDHLVQQLAEKIKADKINLENKIENFIEKASDKIENTTEDLKEKITE